MSTSLFAVQPSTHLLALHPDRDHASRPNRVCTPAVKLHAMQNVYGYTTPQHPQIGQKLTVDEQSHVFRAQVEFACSSVTARLRHSQCL